MREIKFRGKRTDNGEWICGSLILLADKALIAVTTDTHDHTTYVSGAVDLKTVGQFTGRYDGNGGHEIFEGDMLRIYTYYCEEEPELNEWKDREVIWIESAKCLAIEWDYGDYHLTTVGLAIDYFDDYGHRIEVIGNIHDNPELLQGAS